MKYAFYMTVNNIWLIKKIDILNLRSYWYRTVILKSSCNNKSEETEFQYI